MGATLLDLLAGRYLIELHRYRVAPEGGVQAALAVAGIDKILETAEEHHIRADLLRRVHPDIFGGNDTDWGY